MIAHPKLPLTFPVEPFPRLAPGAARPLIWLGTLASAMPALGVRFGGSAFGGFAAEGGSAERMGAEVSCAKAEVVAPRPRSPARRVSLSVAAASALFGAVGSTPAGTAWAALSHPGRAGPVLAGLLMLGASLVPVGPRSEPGTLAGRQVIAGAGEPLVLLVAWTADGAASGWGLPEPVPPWSPRVTATLLDLSPRTLLMESGGADWLRHPSVDEPAGTDRIGPGLRSVFAGQVAVSATLLVGCGGLAVRYVFSRRLDLARSAGTSS